MKRALFTFVACVPLLASALDRDRLADAIYLAEGGPRAKVPYGILSVPVHTAAEARQACLRTIDHAWADYSALRNPKSEFIPFLGDRYCPPADAAGNRHWKHNVKYFYAHLPITTRTR